MMDTPPNTAPVRSIQLSASRAHTVLPCVDSLSPCEPTSARGLTRVVLVTKLWFWRSFVDVEYRVVGRGRAHARLIEARLHGQLWRIRLRAFLRRGRRVSAVQAASLKMAPAKPIS